MSQRAVISHKKPKPQTCLKGGEISGCIKNNGWNKIHHSRGGIDRYVKIT